MKKMLFISLALCFLSSTTGTAHAFKEIVPGEFDLNDHESIRETFGGKKDGFLADYEVGLYTEADCDNITWTFSGQTHSYTAFCGSGLSFTDVPAGEYEYTVTGCGGSYTKNKTIDHDVNIVVCPFGLGITECCSEGLLVDGSYACDDQCPESGTSDCPTEQIYGAYSAETELLREFRDKVLRKTPEGKEMIKLYYEWSPAIVEAMEGDQEFKKQVKEILDGVLLLMGRNN